MRRFPIVLTVICLLLPACCLLPCAAKQPAGKARFGQRYVDVVTDGAFVTKGSRVKVVEIRGNRVVVEEADEEG